MNGHTLILNKNWVAVDVTTIFGAIIKMCRDSARAMCPDTYELFDLEQWISRSIERESNLPINKIIRAANYPIEKPEILLLKDYGGVPFTQVNFTRRNMYKRDMYICQYCKGKFTPKDLTMDHVHPKSKGGGTSWTNCVTSCYDCNSRKSNRSLQESGMVLLREPKAPKWTPIAGLIPNKRPDSWSKFLKI